MIKQTKHCGLETWILIYRKGGHVIVRSFLSYGAAWAAQQQTGA